MKDMSRYTFVMHPKQHKQLHVAAANAEMGVSQYLRKKLSEIGVMDSDAVICSELLNLAEPGFIPAQSQETMDNWRGFSNSNS